MTIVFIIFMVAVGCLLVYEIFSLVRTIIKIRKQKKDKHKTTEIKKGE